MLRGYALKGHSWLLARSGHDKKKLQRGVRAPCWSCWLVWLLWQSQQKWSLAQPLALGKPVWPVFLFQSTATLWPRCQDGLLRVCWWSGVRSPVGAHGLFFLFSFPPLCPTREAELSLMTGRGEKPGLESTFLARCHALFSSVLFFF